MSASGPGLEYVQRLRAQLTEVAVERELEALSRGKPVPESVHEIRALIAEGGIVGKDGTGSAPIEDFADKRRSVEAQRSPSWWDEHTVVRLVVTHLNEHGARVLFTMPGRGIDLVSETPAQAERQLAFARERWPEGVFYEVREARFWREADGSPGNPVHTLVDDDLPTDRAAAIVRATQGGVRTGTR